MRVDLTYVPKRPMILRFVYPQTGERFRWRLYRDDRKPVAWMLEDHDGYLRHAGETYAEAVPFVRMIAENHDFKFLHDFS